MPKVDEESELVRHFRARLDERPTYRCDLADLLRLPDGLPCSVAVRVPTRREVDRALVHAHDYVAQAVKGSAGADAAASDGDLLQDAKSIAIICEAVRRADEPRYPAFRPDQMRELMSTDDIAVLLHVVNDVQRRYSPLYSELGAERVLDIARSCAAHADSGVPEAALARADRSWLAAAFVELACATVAQQPEAVEATEADAAADECE